MVEVLHQQEGLFIVWKPAGVPLETPQNDGGLALKLRNGELRSAIESSDSIISPLHVIGPRLIRGIEGPIIAANPRLFQAYVDCGACLRGTVTYAAVIASSEECEPEFYIKIGAAHGASDETASMSHLVHARVIQAGRSLREEHLALIAVQYEGDLVPSRSLASAAGSQGKATPPSLEKELARALVELGRPLLGEGGRKSRGRKGWHLSVMQLDVKTPLEGCTSMQFQRAPPAHFRSLLESETNRWKARHDQDAIALESLGVVPGSEPFEYVMGEAKFCGLRLAVNPSVMVPIVGPEALVSMVVDIARQAGDRIRILDLGTGSGCILLASLVAP